MKSKAIVRLPLGSKRQLDAVLKALTPEVKKQVGERANVSVAAEGLTLVLNVEARDTVALRAALNAYLRWICSTISVLEALEKDD